MHNRAAWGFCVPATIELIGVSFHKFLHTLSLLIIIYHLLGLEEDSNEAAPRLSSVFWLGFPNHKVEGRRIHCTGWQGRAHPTSNQTHQSMLEAPGKFTANSFNVFRASWFSPRTGESHLKIQ